jgi:hypothetical protein
LKGDPQSWRTDYWYSTGTATSSFTPNDSNPFYWTKTETTYDSFIISMNWNNGQGLNNGTIIDKILDITFELGKNSSKDMEDPYGPKANWDKYIYQGQEYGWHLYWVKGNTIKSYFFTINDPANPGKDIVYQIDSTSPGGNESQASGRTVTSENFFPRSFEEGDQEKLFDWDGDTLVTKNDAQSQLKLQPQPLPTGSLTVIKTLEDNFIDWGVNSAIQFTTKVQDKESGDYLTFEVLGGDPGNHYTYTGISAAGSELIFSAAAPSLIKDIPANRICIVEELIGGDHVDISYSLDEAAIASGQNTAVTVTNRYEHGEGTLVVTKLFDGFPSDWGINDSTVFKAKIWDIADGYYLIFKASPEADGSYKCVGNEVEGLSELYFGKTTSEIPLSAGQSVSLTNIWPGRNYEVREINAEQAANFNGNWEVVYSGDNGNTLIAGENLNIMVTNRFKHGAGNLAIFKEIAGHFEDWGANSSTQFTARVKDVITGNYLLFKDIPEADGSYRCVGNDVDGLSEAYDGEVVSEITLNVEKPLLLSNLWTGKDHFYQVEETPEGIIPGHYSVDYSSPDGIIEADGSMIVTVTNTYRHGAGNLAIYKELDINGYPEDWDVDRSTVFTAKVMDVADGNYLIFKGTPETDGSYRCVGNDVDGLSEAYDGEIISEVAFSVIKPVLLSNMWPEREYEVLEITEDAFFSNARYSNNSKEFSQGESMAVTVVNTFKHGAGDLVIHKDIAGGYADLPVNGFTEFKVRVKDVEADNYLIFKAAPEEDGSYRCVGNDVNGLSEPYDGEIIFAVAISVNEPIVLSNLWPGLEYEVEEISAGNYTASYSLNSKQLNQGECLNVTVTNTYDADTPPAALYSVIYDGNGHTGGAAPAGKDYQAGSTVIIPGPGNLSKTSCKFLGWALSAAAIAADYVYANGAFAPAHFIITEDTTLYAVWEQTGSSGGGQRVSTPAPTPIAPTPQPTPVNDVLGAKEPQPDLLSMFANDHIWYIWGYKDNTIRPEKDITRAEIAMVFFRLLKPELKNFTPNTLFNDVTGQEWHGPAINTLAHHGVFSGFTDGSFRPNQPITRGELATVISRLTQLPATEENPFDDLDPQDWAYGNILSAAKQGWFHGDNSSSFRPKDNLKRAEFVTVVNRIFNRCLMLEDIPGNVYKFDDFSNEHWAYCDFMEAIHTHEYERKEDGISEMWTEIVCTGFDSI